MSDRIGSSINYVSEYSPDRGMIAALAVLLALSSPRAEEERAKIVVRTERPADSTRKHDAVVANQ